jgi:predicted phage-related endonuclease
VSDDLRFVRYPDRESWLEARRFAIGSSDAAAIMGESNWASPVSLNYSKRGLLPAVDPDADRELELDWHRKREDEIARWWWERLQVQVETLAFRAGGPCFLFDPGDYTIAYRTLDGVPLSATFDRLLIRDTQESSEAAVRLSANWPAHLNENVGEPALWETISRHLVAVVELKNAGHWMAKHWEQEPPLIYTLQLTHQQMVADVRPGYLVASIGGQPPVWAELHRDGEIASILRDRYARFWASVVGNYDFTPVDGSDVTGKAISARFGEGNGETVKLDGEALTWWKRREDAAARKANACELYAEATNNLKASMAEAWFGLLPDGKTLSLKPNKAGRRDLRLVGGDGDEAVDATSVPFGEF